MSTFKPNGYNSVSPYIISSDAKRLINLLDEIFGVEQLRVYKRDDGTVMHGEIRIDDSVIMISQATEQYPPSAQIFHVYVPDSDKTYDKAVKQGCEAIGKPVIKEGETDKRGSFKDFDGNWWSVSTDMS